MAEVVASAGLRPLKDTPLPSGNRELRIWFGGGLGWPQDLFRFQIKNGSAKGQWIRYWSVAIDEDGPPEAADFGAVVRYSLAGQCDAMRTFDRTAVCVARFTKRPDWNALLGKIESEGVWTLPDGGELPKEHFPNGMQVIVSDGYEMTVEARDGTNYRSYAYDNPEMRKEDAAKHAAAITAALFSIRNLIPPNTNTRIFRGRYTPAPEYYRFINCGDTTTWGLSLEITPPPLPRDSARDSRSDTIRSAYAEVRGMKAYPGLAKRLGDALSRDHPSRLGIGDQAVAPRGVSLSKLESSVLVGSSAIGEKFTRTRFDRYQYANQIAAPKKSPRFAACGACWSSAKRAATSGPDTIEIAPGRVAPTLMSTIVYANIIPRYKSHSGRARRSSRVVSTTATTGRISAIM